MSEPQRRHCGDCTLCCRLLPVPPLKKPAGQRCEHQRHTGCRIYENRPWSCKLWNCRWIVEDDTADLARPDRSHCVIDMMPDVVRINSDADGSSQTVEVVQIWCDPKHREAWREPSMMAYIERRAAEGRPTLVRYDSGADTVIVFAPPLCSDGGWHTKSTRLKADLLTERKARFGY